MKCYELKGRWTPAEFFQLEGINCTDRFVMSCIYGLDDNGCVASNKYIAEQIAISTRQVEDSISKLKRKGFIKVELIGQEGKRGWTRKIYCKIMVEDPNMTPGKTGIKEGRLPEKRESMPGKTGIKNSTVPGIQTLQSTEEKRDSIERQESISYSLGNLIEEKTGTEVKQSTAQWTPTLGKPLASFAALAVDKYKLPLKLTGTGAWDDQNFERLLSRHGEKRLEQALKVAAGKCSYEALSLKFFLLKIKDLGFLDMPKPTETNFTQETEETIRARHQEYQCRPLPTN